MPNYRTITLETCYKENDPVYVFGVDGRGIIDKVIVASFTDLVRVSYQVRLDNREEPLFASAEALDPVS